MQPANRNSNIELLRIFSMFIIVLYHCVFYCRGGGLGCADTTIVANSIWNRILTMFGGLGVNIFVLISGYCLIKNDQCVISIVKLLKFYGQLLFYNGCITIPYIIVCKHTINLSEIFGIIFPISKEIWWFASAYFILLVLHPFINKFLLLIKKEEYHLYLSVIFFLASVIPFYSYFSSALSWFICLYSLSAYVKLYGVSHNIKHIHYGIVTILSITFIVTSSYIIESIPVIAGKYMFFYGKRGIPMLILSFSIFMSFLTRKDFHSRLVNMIGLSTFGIYLISDHKIVRNFIWEEWFNKFTDVQSQFFIIKSLIYVAMVFICCSIVDIVRYYTLEQLYLKLINFLAKKTQTIALSIKTYIEKSLDRSNSTPM